MKKASNSALIPFMVLLTIGTAPAGRAVAGDEMLSTARISESVEAVLSSFRLRAAEARNSGSKAHKRAALIGLATSLEWANNMEVRKPPEVFLSEKVEIYEELISLEEALGNSHEASRYQSNREALCSGWDLESC